jgi:hypothetical protein
MSGSLSHSTSSSLRIGHGQRRQGRGALHREHARAAARCLGRARRSPVERLELALGQRLQPAERLGVDHLRRAALERGELVGRLRGRGVEKVLPSTTRRRRGAWRTATHCAM